MAKKVINHNVSEPLGNVKEACVKVNPGDGNLAITSLPGSEKVLVTGSLQYLENKGLPTSLVETSNGKTTLSLKADIAQSWLRLPWAACNGATNWQIQLNPNVLYDINAHSDGGNINLDLSSMNVTNVSADTGGGNIDVALSAYKKLQSVTAKSGAGNVSVYLPAGIAAKVHAKSGLGKVIMDSRFSEIDGNTYQSFDYDTAADKVEIIISSGAGNVSVVEEAAH